MQTYVLGHKNPDTDSIVSAIAVADLFNYIPVKSGAINKETQYILDKFSVDVPADLPAGDKKVVLVDHNEPDQIKEEVQHEEILAIYDHHKLGGLYTSEPITVWHEPVGSTSTIASDLYKYNGKEVPAKIASILIAGIVSDTLNFTSPTTTEKDKEVARFLNEIAQIDIEELAKEMFAAKSDISDLETTELIEKDYKVFTMGDKKVGIGVWETTNPASVLERKLEIHQVLKDKKAKENLDYILFAAVDIIEGAAHFVLDMDPEVALVADVFEGVAQEGVACVKGIVSRKKQIVPSLEKFLTKN